jgi:dTDP-4-dehydrorhamnose 3,5-epimerase
VRHSDERGFFSTCFPQGLLQRLDRDEVYISASVTSEARTVRGMHFQTSPFEESKLLTVVQGKIFDVLINLDSSLEIQDRIHTFEISGEVNSCLFIPKGFAHGYQTLSDDTIVLYALDSKFDKSSTRGFSPLSSQIRDLWPHDPINIKKDDLVWPSLD